MSDTVDEPADVQEAAEFPGLLDTDPSELNVKEDIRRILAADKRNGDVVELPRHAFSKLFLLLEEDGWTVVGMVVTTRTIDKIFVLWNGSFDNDQVPFQLARKLSDLALDAVKAGVKDLPKHALYEKIARSVANIFQEYEVDDLKAVLHVETGMSRLRAVVQEDVDDIIQSPQGAEFIEIIQHELVQQEQAHDMKQPSGKQPLPSLTNLRRLLELPAVDFGTTAYSPGFNTSFIAPNTADSTVGGLETAASTPQATTGAPATQGQASSARPRRGNRTNHTALPYTDREKLVILLVFRDFANKTSAFKADKVNEQFTSIPDRTSDAIRQQYNLLIKNGKTISELRRELGEPDSGDEEEAAEGAEGADGEEADTARADAVQGADVDMQ